ncbi:MAG: hypothetical protein ACR2IE_16710 [Candidatus Sumerlaeaceae bacterium]
MGVRPYITVLSVPLHLEGATIEYGQRVEWVAADQVVPEDIFDWLNPAKGIVREVALADGYRLPHPEQAEHLWVTEALIMANKDFPRLAGIDGERCTARPGLGEIFVSRSLDIYFVDDRSVTQIHGTFARNELLERHGEVIGDLRAHLYDAADEYVQRKIADATALTKSDFVYEHLDQYLQALDNVLRPCVLHELEPEHLDDIALEVLALTNKLVRS